MENCCKLISYKFIQWICVKMIVYVYSGFKTFVKNVTIELRIQQLVTKFITVSLISVQYTCKSKVITQLL